MGGGEIAGAVGVLMLAAIGGLTWRRLTREAQHLFLAGTAAALTMDASIAFTRASVVQGDWLNFNRYIALVAVFLLLAAAPVVLGVLATAINTRAANHIFALACAFVFMVNLSSLLQYRTITERWQMETAGLVLQAAAQTSRGCPGGRLAANDAQPVKVLAPDVTIDLLERLQRKAVWSDANQRTTAISPSIRSSICLPSGEGR
jgi:hypothetical protein